MVLYYIIEPLLYVCVKLQSRRKEGMWLYNIIRNKGCGEAGATFEVWAITLLRKKKVRVKMLLQTQFLSCWVQHLSPGQTQGRLFLRINIKSEKASSDDSGPSKTGVGFGSSDTAAVPVSSKKKKKAQRERASIIRRSPLEKPAFVSEQQVGKAKEENKNESAFLLAWLGFGVVILVEGIALAASGTLPTSLSFLSFQFNSLSLTFLAITSCACLISFSIIHSLLLFTNLSF